MCFVLKQLEVLDLTCSGCGLLLSRTGVATNRCQVARIRAAARASRSDDPDAGGRWPAGELPVQDPTDVIGFHDRQRVGR